MRYRTMLVTMAMAVAGATPLVAQQPVVYLAGDGSPFGLATATDAEHAAQTMPDLSFDPATVDPESYEKYYYFHRPDTDFATAFADINECDDYARGLRTAASPNIPGYAASLPGAVGGLIGSAAADLIVGSGERRRMRRINMRACMGIKEYRRYGLERERWQAFHFEEGLNAVSEEDRRPQLIRQAMVASGPVPTAKVLPR